VAWVDDYLHTKWHLDPSSSWTTIDMGLKFGGSVALLGELGPHLNRSRLGRGLPLYQVTYCSIQPFGHNRHGPKIGGCAPFGGAGSPSNTMLPGPRSTSIPNILIHPSVWPLYIPNVTDRQAERQTGQDRQRSDSIHRANRVISGRPRPQTAQPSRMPFGLRIRVEPMNHELDGV